MFAPSKDAPERSAPGSKVRGEGGRVGGRAREREGDREGGKISLVLYSVHPSN